MAEARSFDDLVTEVGKLRADFEDFKTTAAGRFPSFERAVGQPLRLTGATEPTRYVGRTDGARPSTGTFEVGDFVIGRSGQVFVCVTAGSPGSWVGQGVVSLATETSDTTTTATSAGSAATINTLGPVTVYGGRTYLIAVPTFGAYMSDLSSTGVMCAQVTYTTNGDAPTASSPRLTRTLVYCVPPALSNSGTVAYVYVPPVDHTLRLLLSAWRAATGDGSSGTFYASDDDAQFVLCDLGD